VSFRQNICKYGSKLKVYTYYCDGTFDYRDTRRLKPHTRLRCNEDEVRLDQENDIKLRVKDWYKDIDRGYSK
jgi:hypothetical protein